MAELREGRDLECPDCGGHDCFTRVEGAKVTANGQIVHPPRGIWCLKCNKGVSGADLLRREEMRRKKEDLERLQKEVAAAEGVAKPVARVTDR